MEEEYNKIIEQIIAKEKNGEPLTLGEASMLSSYRISQMPKFDFSGVKVIKNDRVDDFDER